MTFSVKVEGLSKRYRLGLTHAGSLRELVNSTAGRIFGRSSGEGRGAKEQFWALHDVNFEIRQGDTVGIIGRNGAGKSTLLKILSRITSPTQGRAELVGRVASLLEVGTGFHPELTGRENVYLNGTILGMTRAEVNRQFDAIVDFAGIDKFIDTPVKRYSSGMKVRLGFAVAAHLEPEILIVDEVLAVGDIDFQRKCLGKMDDVARSGRTILFVSHNMAAVSQLCRTGIILDQGKTEGTKPIDQAIDLYMKQSPGMEKGGTFCVSDEQKDNQIRKIQVRQAGEAVGTVRHDEEFDLQFSLNLADQRPNLRLSIAVCNRLQQKIFTAISEIDSTEPCGDYEQTLRIRGRFLMPGGYSLIAGLLDARSQLLDWQRYVCPFEIENVGDELMTFGNGDFGIVFGEHQWLTPSKP
ncbi:MAG: polysaccharide ABC transporter ATP-binding protein [Planctomycetota bacterium]